MHNKHLLHLDIVSAYLHAVLTGPPRFIALWKDKPGTVRQLFKAMNGVDNAAQLWSKHFHKFMLQEGLREHQEMTASTNIQHLWYNLLNM